MKIVKLIVITLACLSFIGCSIPSVAQYNQLYSLTKQEIIKKGGFGNKKKVVTIKDFRGNEMYIEDISGLKEEAEKYIADHPELNDATKESLREIKISIGMDKKEVELLLGEPDKICGRKDSETWIYCINKWRAFTVFIFPVFFVREAYYLRFKGSSLTGIERHYLNQVIRQASGPGITSSSH